MNDRPPIPARTIRWPVAGETLQHGKNRFTIGEPLGRGSYGATFACVDQWENELVIKVLVPYQQTYEQVRINWQREMESLLTLRHPNITYVHDAFELEATFHIVMERCGGSISSLFSLPDYDGDDWLLPIARCLLQGVAFIHDRGYVHKDIHLRNVFWTYLRSELMPNAGPVMTFKVGDLGVTRFEHEVQSTRPTIPWMVAPEVLDPDRFGRVGKATDIYHAGLVLLAVALGIEPSFAAEEIVQGVPRSTAEQLPSPLGAAVGHALRRHAAARPASAFEFWRELRGQGQEGAAAGR